jgi:2-iminobutanoate/2-iminopropanoate deaminase
MKEIVSERAPKPIGPYSQAVEAGGFVFCSGQIGIEPENNMLKEGITEQTRQALTNIERILEASGTSVKNVVKVTVYLADMKYFNEMNQEYSRHFSKPYPARTTVQVSSLPRNALVEIDAIATI